MTTNIHTIKCDIEIRYWEDAQVNGIDDIAFCDTCGECIPQIPCAVQVKNKSTNCIYSDHWRWRPEIDIQTGRIKNWKQGTTAYTSYKVCDEFACAFLDTNDNIVGEYEGYVPSFMSPSEEGYGDYMCMHIDENGYIRKWDASKALSFCHNTTKRE